MLRRTSGPADLNLDLWPRGILALETRKATRGDFSNRGQFRVLILACFLTPVCPHPPDLQEPLAVDASEELDQCRDTAGPTRLMTRANSCAVISVEVLVEQDVILPVPIGLEFLTPAVNRPTSSFVPEEDPG